MRLSYKLVSHIHDPLSAVGGWNILAWQTVSGSSLFKIYASGAHRPRAVLRRMASMVAVDRSASHLGNATRRQAGPPDSRVASPAPGTERRRGDDGLQGHEAWMLPVCGDDGRHIGVDEHHLVATPSANDYLSVYDACSTAIRANNAS